jgi:threonine dehydratase
LQPIGSFKIRGAMNAVAAHRADLADGVWTVSAGNAAQGVASPPAKPASTPP